MKLSELKQIIKNGGATLNKSGEIIHFVRGYQVSKKDCYTLEIRNVRKILRAVNRLLKSVSFGEFVGIWIDDGKAYIDISERIERLSVALPLGVARKQKSIYDWCMNRCISLEG